MFPKNKKVFFIGSSSYSGSTILDMMLANCPEGFSAGEVYALFRPYRPINFELKPKCGCGNPNCDLWVKVRKAGEKNLYKTIFTLMNDISFIVDSSKNPWWIKKQSEHLQSQGVEVFHILIWKEPAAFAYSMVKRKRKNWKKFWKNYYKLYFSLIKDYLCISYDDLAQYPDMILHDLCNKTGIIFTQDRAKYWEKKHHILFGNELAKKHQSIYYDRSYLKLLPAAIKKDINEDSEIKKIVSILQNKNEPYCDICFSQKQLAVRKIACIVKFFAGRILGRYWQIF